MIATSNRQLRNRQLRDIFRHALLTRGDIVYRSSEG
jgi:hypothetical protein